MDSSRGQTHPPLTERAGSGSAALRCELSTMPRKGLFKAFSRRAVDQRKVEEEEERKRKEAAQLYSDNSDEEADLLVHDFQAADERTGRMVYLSACDEHGERPISNFVDKLGEELVVVVRPARCCACMALARLTRTTMPETPRVEARHGGCHDTNAQGVCGLLVLLLSLVAVLTRWPCARATR